VVSKLLVLTEEVIITLGVLEQIIFPEIDIDKVNKISGMDITFVTSAKTDKEAKSLLAELGLPFKKN
jgi:large subunit ribosomal protein L5